MPKGLTDVGQGIYLPTEQLEKYVAFIREQKKMAMAHSLDPERVVLMDVKRGRMHDALIVEALAFLKRRKESAPPVAELRDLIWRYADNKVYWGR